MTSPDEPKGPSTTREDVAERAAELAADARRHTAYLLTGDVNGRMRRNMLYLTAAGFIIFGFAPLALLPLLLLALTDMVVIQ